MSDTILMPDTDWIKKSFLLLSYDYVNKGQLKKIFLEQRFICEYYSIIDG